MTLENACEAAIADNGTAELADATVLSGLPVEGLFRAWPLPHEVRNAPAPISTEANTRLVPRATGFAAWIAEIASPPLAVAAKDVASLSRRILSAIASM